MMTERIIETNKITTNETEFADKKFKLYDSKRVGTNELLGITLDETPIIFTYRGIDYFLIDNNIIDQNGHTLLSNYLYHYIKDGIIYISNTSNELFIFETSSIFKSRIYEIQSGDQQQAPNTSEFNTKLLTGVSNIIKSNISFIPPNNEETFYDNDGKIFYLIQEDNKLYAQYFGDDGVITTTKKELPPLPKNINLYEIFILKSQNKIHLAFYERNILDNKTIIIITENKINSITIPIKNIEIEQTQFIFLGNNEKIVLIRHIQETITSYIINLNTGIENTQILYLGENNKSESDTNITTNLTSDKYKSVFSYTENRLNIGMIFIIYQIRSNILEKPVSRFKLKYMAVALSYRINKDNIFVLSGTNKITSQDIDYGTGTNISNVITTFTRIPLNIIMFISSNNISILYHLSRPDEKDSIIWEKPNIETTLLSESYPNIQYNEIFEKFIWENISKKYEDFIVQSSLIFNEVSSYEIEVGSIILQSPIVFQTQSLKLIQSNVFTSYFIINQINKIGQQVCKPKIYDFQSFNFMDKKQISKQFDGMIINKLINTENILFNTFSRNDLKEDWKVFNSFFGNKLNYQKNYVFYDNRYNDIKTDFDYKDNNSLRINQKFSISFKNIQEIFIITQATENYFIVYKNDLQTVYIQNINNISNNTEFISFQQNILDITGVQQGIFIAHEQSLSFLQALGTGDGIQLSVTNYKLDNQDIMIGFYTTVYYGNGFITYIYNNNIKKIPLPINSDPINVIQHDTYYLIEDKENRLLMLNPNDGTLSILSISEKIDFYIFYSLIKEKETNKIYGIKNTGNPKYQMEFSNNKLITLLEISSYNNIIKAIIKDIEIKPILHYNKYKINVNMAIQKNNPIFLEFKDKINDDIILGVK
ncbi:MAG: hypothetical protein ACRC31_05415 [Cetobacterium sp.]